MIENRLTCDYLVVGAGTACLSFVDVVLARRKEATFVIVDRLSAPGGHWTMAYPYVRLHQPSAYYGVNSLPLSKTDKKGNEPFDQNIRASAKEICDYFRKVVDNFEATGRVKTYFETNYEGEARDENEKRNVDSNSYSDPKAKITHIITTKDGETIFVDCTKVVRCESNVVVPSMRDSLPFPIDDSAEWVNPNKLPDILGSNLLHNNYLVVGGGKTGVDAVIYLLKSGKVTHDQITWIVPRPSWYFVSTYLQSKDRPGKLFWKDAVENILKPLLNANSSKEAFLNMEKRGVTQRVDPNDGHFPLIFKGATVSQDDMDNLRKIRNIVKLKGRVTSITDREVIFANGAHSIPFSPSNTLVIDCTVEETYGYMKFGEDFQFFNPHKIRLGPFTSMFNPSHTCAQVGFLESVYCDTAAGDEMKNSFLFFPPWISQGRDDNFLAYFLLSFYAQQRTDFAFEKCPDYQKWVLKARTDRNLPGHHGGILGLVWAVLGPVKLLKTAIVFGKKLENGAYEDLSSPMFTRPGPDGSKHKANLRYPPTPKKEKQKAKRAARSLASNRQQQQVGVEQHSGVRETIT